MRIHLGRKMKVHSIDFSEKAKSLEITMEGEYLPKDIETQIVEIFDLLGVETTIEYWADFDGKFRTTAFFMKYTNV